MKVREQIEFKAIGANTAVCGIYVLNATSSFDWNFQTINIFPYKRPWCVTTFCWQHFSIAVSNPVRIKALPGFLLLINKRVHQNPFAVANLCTFHLSVETPERIKQSICALLYWNSKQRNAEEELCAGNRNRNEHLLPQVTDSVAALWAHRPWGTTCPELASGMAGQFNPAKKRDLYCNNSLYNIYYFKIENDGQFICSANEK